MTAHIPSRIPKGTWLTVLVASLIMLSSACTTVTDTWADEIVDGSASDSAPNDTSDAAAEPEVVQDTTPEPCDDVQQTACASQNKTCVGGFCADCVPGFSRDQAGVCTPDACAGLNCEDINRACNEENNTCGDCLPGFGLGPTGDCIAGQCGPGTCINQFCEDGFCLGCLPGFYEDEDGVCREPNPCAPNPCTKPNQSACSISVEEPGTAVCSCTDGAVLNEAGDCVFDPCLDNPCAGLETSYCTYDYSPEVECVCPPGSVAEPEGCVSDPCEPNPCTQEGRTTCTVKEDFSAQCECDLGLELVNEENCEEARVSNLFMFPEEDDPVTIGYGWNLFADDRLVEERPSFVRKVHPIVFDNGGSWLIAPEPENAQIVQARSAGSLIRVPQALRDKLPDGHPLKPYGWRLYYMGYRQALANDTQPAWLCIAAAESPEGPWIRPTLDPTSPEKNCTLRVDGLFQAEVSLRGEQWILSATRLGLGDAQQEPGIHVYESTHGLFWEPPPGASGPVIGMNVAPTSPAKYGRASELSRLVYDDRNDRFVAYLGLISNALGNARGVYFGQSSPQPQSGWKSLPSPLESPGILGPTQTDVLNGETYGDMVVWREGNTYLALVQKGSFACDANEVFLATSSDQRHWLPVIDEELAIPVPVAVPTMGASFGRINSLTGGAPASKAGIWSFFMGAEEQIANCGETVPAGGVVRATSRAGGLAGLVATSGSQAKLVTRKLRLTPGLAPQELRVNADVNDKLIVTLEKLSPIGTKLVAMQKVVSEGSYTDLSVTFGVNDSIAEATSDVFQLSFLFTDGGELFGFQLDDPLCSPNPCKDIPGKSTCASVGGEAVCQCDPPLHDDGEGNCTEDPCKPDPCTQPNQSQCELVDGEPVCGCEEGWVPYSAVCIADPCQEGQDADGNTLPAPCHPLKCQALAGTPECFCPEGSMEALAGCVETDMKVFVTTMDYDASEIGGSAAADAICTAEAVNNGLLGSYAAWLSTSDAPAAVKFAQGGPWRTYDPTYNLWTKLVATNIGDLVDGALEAPINFTAAGKPKGDNCLTWTGTTPKGQATPPVGNVGGSCGQWSTVTPGASAMAGQCSKTDASWTSAGPRSCSDKLALYCFQVF